MCIAMRNRPRFVVRLRVYRWVCQLREPTLRRVVTLAGALSQLDPRVLPLLRKQEMRLFCLANIVANILLSNRDAPDEGNVRLAWLFR